MPKRGLVEIDVKPGPMTDTQSGVSRLKPRILGALVEPDQPTDVAAIVMHPTNSFLGHPLLEPLAGRGIAMLGLNSRYMNNDATLLMERAIQDLGAGVGWLRGRGFRKVFLIGFSGGAALSCFYQAQAEHLTLTHTGAGDPIAIEPADMPPADGISLVAAHLGRSRLLLDWIDPSVTDDRDPQSVDPALDMYDAANGPAYSSDFLKRYRSGQRVRRDRIEAAVKERLAYVRSRGIGSDEAMVVHRTFADPRFMDLTLDPNDREPGGIWGNAREVNYAANAIGRYSTLTAFLSQWASTSQADGPTNVALASVPLQYIELNGDASAFPTTTAIWRDAIASRASGGDADFTSIAGADHYLKRAPEHLALAADAIEGWVRRT